MCEPQGPAERQVPIFYGGPNDFGTTSQAARDGTDITCSRHYKIYLVTCGRIHMLIRHTNVLEPASQRTPTWVT